MSTTSADVLAFPLTRLGESDRLRGVFAARLHREEAAGALRGPWGRRVSECLEVTSGRPSPAGDCAAEALWMAHAITENARMASRSSRPGESTVPRRVFARMRATTTRPVGSPR